MKKILEICQFSAGICGVWTRVKQEALALAKEGFDVTVFSSNIVKGTNKTADSSEKIGPLKIRRFPVKYQVGENALFWNFEKEALSLNPDIIIVHVYRHPYTNKALKIKKKLEKQGKEYNVFLVTHAPFVPPELRSRKLQLAVKLYDLLFKKNLNKFDKVITITKWEEPFLAKLGIKPEKITYIPNPIPEEFFTTPIKKGKGLLFFGRVAPIKSLETLVEAISKISPHPKLNIIGPAEENYKQKITNKIKSLKINSIKFSKPIYGLQEKIKKIDSHEIFILPSKREAMPQALIEAMARSKIVIASNTKGAREIIHHQKNGFLFQRGNADELAKIISFCLNKKNSLALQKIRENARKYVRKFSTTQILKKWLNLLNS